MVTYRLLIECLVTRLGSLILVGSVALFIGFLPIWLGLSPRPGTREWGHSHRRAGFALMAIGILLIGIGYSG